jgi:hypothetical protein
MKDVTRSGSVFWNDLQRGLEGAHRTVAPASLFPDGRSRWMVRHARVACNYCRRDHGPAVLHANGRKEGTAAWARAQPLREEG